MFGIYDGVLIAIGGAALGGFLAYAGVTLLFNTFGHKGYAPLSEKERTAEQYIAHQKQGLG